jgi:hypothetical protein
MGTGFPYGQFKIPRTLNGGRQVGCYAHRMAWILTHGPIPDGLHICHRCDVPLCCNPSHLFLGTQGDNNRDAFAKGRQPKVRVRKLTDAQVAEIRTCIRKRGDAQRMAVEFGVSKACISQIVHGRRKPSSVRHALTLPTLQTSAVGEA